MNTGIDGGMHRVFAAKLPEASTGLSEGGDGQGLSLAALTRAPGTIPAHVNPPRGPITAPEEPLAASLAPAPAAAPASAAATRVAAASPGEKSEGFFSSLARKVGLGSAAETTATAQPAPAKPKVEAKRHEASLPKAAAAAKPADTKQAAARPPLKPSVSEAAPASPAPAANGQVAGSQPVVPANSFESRFGAMK
jgi:hypothetical protein